MSGSLRERRRELLRTEILEAAWVLVAEKGHEGMSMDELAAMVGISKPTLYSYFDTKEELVVAALERTMQQVIAVLEVDVVGKTPLQRMKLLVRTILQFQIDEETQTVRAFKPDTFKFLCEHERTHALIQQLDLKVVSLAQEAVAQGEVAHELDVPMVVWAFYGVLNALNEGPMSKAGTPNLATLADALASIFERGVRVCGCSGEPKTSCVS